MRILHVISGLRTGGAERSMARLVEHARGAGHDCWVLSVSGDGPVVDALGDTPVLCCDLPGAGLKGWRRGSGFARALKPDLIHGWMYHGNLLASLLARRLQAPLLWDVRHSLRRLADERLTTRWVIRISGWPIWSPDRVVFNSEAGRRSHAPLGYDRWPSTVIRNGVELARYAGRSREAARERLGVSGQARVLGWVARAHPMKDLDTFLAAAGALAARYPDLRVVLVGAGMDDGNLGLRRGLEAHGLTGRAQTLGERTDLAELYVGFDLVMLTSRWGEGTPNVLLEALAAGVPCVTTDVGDAAAVLADPACVAPLGDVEALVRAAGRVLDRTAFARDEAAAANQERMRNELSQARCFSLYEGVYQGLVQ